MTEASDLSGFRSLGGQKAKNALQTVCSNYVLFVGGLADMVREVENVFARALKAIPEADLLAYFIALGVSEQKRAAVLREYHAQRGAVARPLPLITPPPARGRTRAQRLNAGSLAACLKNMWQQTLTRHVIECLETEYMLAPQGRSR